MQVSAAEEIQGPAESVQLVTACTCCPYFDIPRFFAEADRVLVPAGILAIYSFTVPKVYHNGVFSTELTNIWLQAYKVFACGWSPVRKDVEDGYRDPRFRLPFPGEVRDEGHYQDQTLTLDGVLAYIKTFGCYQKMVRRCGAKRGEALLQQTKER
ncbi:uncharacterized protein LOC119104690 [Pollicipes pollicipes]|uniref:uncharacterized protein LOC119104690 n=1 Tax=Pollicipes pollicipes TaxID=41117 RepID=UPI001884A832|nr:uncharacterized protein LOC119104690 [Pollicipes pollicipes]